MALRMWYTDPPNYHRLEIDNRTKKRLMQAGHNNRHYFISREAVEDLLACPEVDDDDKAKLKEWLVASPGEDELYFSVDY